MPAGQPQLPPALVADAHRATTLVPEEYRQQYHHALRGNDAATAIKFLDEALKHCSDKMAKVIDRFTIDPEKAIFYGSRLAQALVELMRLKVEMTPFVARG